MKFIDTAEIRVKAGDGGAGCTSFRREKFVPRGGPDGGDGGRGGNVTFLANRHLTTLLDFQYQRVHTAARGEHGMGSRKTGRSGKSIVLEVPVGTLVIDAASGETVADMIAEGQEFIAARGGQGGRGNAAFASATNQAPRNYEQGAAGEERELLLELKLLADVGLVGFPNAGKSTLISVISAAKPKIADYPFTTLTPNLGIVRVDMGRSFVVADIPGLVKGAHLGKGLGIQFLRHIERTRILVFLIESISEDPLAEYKILLEELHLFNKNLSSKPRIVVLTKADLVYRKKEDAIVKIKFPRVKGGRSPVPCHVVSAVSGYGIKDLVAEMWHALQKHERITRQSSVLPERE